MITALILARGGSRRVPRKNIRDFRGMPMLTYPIETAKAAVRMGATRASKLFDLIVVCTDDAEIAACAFRCGAVVVPRPYDDGATGTQEVAARVLDQMDLHGGMTCVIYPCTPLLTPQLLELGKQYLLRPEAKCFARAVGPDGADAGSFYWGWTRAFRDRKPLDAFNTIDVPLPAERVCDVDTMEDWARCEAMFDALKGNP